MSSLELQRLVALYRTLHIESEILATQINTLQIQYKESLDKKYQINLQMRQICPHTTSDDVGHGNILCTTCYKIYPKTS
jgi:hypothetical protein